MKRSVEGGVGARRPLIDGKHAHWLAIHETQMEKAHLEAQTLARPK